MAGRNLVARYGAWATCAAIAGGLLLVGGNALLAEPGVENAGGTAAIAPDAATASYSPPVRFGDEDTNLYWGDTHVYTSNSADAFGLGNSTIGPDDAFRFATGEKLPPAMACA